MLLWIVIVILAAAVWTLRGRLAKLEREIEDLHYELGRSVRSEPARPTVATPTPVMRPTVSATPPVPPAAPPAPAPPPIRAVAPEPPKAASFPAPPTAADFPKPPPAPPPAPPRAASPPPPPPPPTGGRAPSAGRPKFNLEHLIGVRLFSAVAGLALAVAAVFFLRYSIEAGWLAPPVRVAIGIAVGLALIIACELKAARKYPLTANALDAAAVAILFSTFFAAHALWHLIGSGAAFGLLVLVTAIAVLLSIRRDSLFIALLGLLGGFSTPALLSTGENRPFALFGYLLLLNVGLAWVAQRKRWPFLTALSLVFTVLYQWGWVMRFLTAPQLPTALGIFLVFPVFTFVALAMAPETPAPAGRWGAILRHVPTVSAALPLAFAVYLATVPAYGARVHLLFGFLFVLALGLWLIAAGRGPASLHFLGAFSVVMVWVVWLRTSYAPRAWPIILAWLAAFVLLYLLLPWLGERGAVARRLARAKELATVPARYAAYAAPALLFAFPAFIWLEPRALAPRLVFGVLLVLLAACAWFAVARGEGPVHFIAAFFALAAEAVWSSRALDRQQLLPALGVYLAFGLFYIGVPILARRRGRPFEPRGAGGVLALVSIALLLFLAGGAVAQTALWGIALLLAILNAGLFVEASHSRIPGLSLIGVLLSWFVLAVWWWTAAVSLALLPALVVLGGFSVLALAGNVWARARASADARAEFDGGVYLGLIGHLFLAFVAIQPSLSIPPWPFLGVMFVLDLAVATASLALRRGELHAAATAASALILIAWTGTARVAPWPSIAIASAALAVALALVWLPLAHKVGARMRAFEGAAALGVLLAQVVAIVASRQGGSPGVARLAAAQTAFVVVALALATRDGWAPLAAAAVLPSAIAVMLWQDAHMAFAFWRDQLTFAAPVLAAFLLYPAILRLRRTIVPDAYLAAVLASAAFFIEARDAMKVGAHYDVIGVLPVGLALLMALLLLGLLRTPRAQVPLGTLALVAGAALAYITVAIPLQLEKHWITVGWALEGAALAWLYVRIPHRGLGVGAGLLLGAVFVRLVLNPAVLTYVPRSETRIWNWFLYTYLIAAASFFFAASRLARTDDRLAKGLPRLSALLPAGGAIILFWLLNIEIADWFATGATITFNFSASLGQDVTYTLGWAVFSVALLAAGILRKSRATRVAAIALLTITVVKAFFHDLRELGGLYRVASFVGLAFCLILVALAIQKFVLTPATAAES